MLEDRFLIWKLKWGNREALARIYEKYRDDLLGLAGALSNEKSFAEDAVHDVFVGFVSSAKQFQLTGSLKSYLATCVANKVRNANRSKQGQLVRLDETATLESPLKRPDQWIIADEEFNRLAGALGQLPYDQREAVVLHVQVDMKFREIAKLQNVSIKTVQSRCRYGLEKLRSLLDNEVEK